MALTEIKVRGVLFDLWGTLIYNLPHRGRSDYEALSHRLGHHTEEIWRTWGSFSEESLRGQIKSGEERARLVMEKLNVPYDAQLAADMARFEYDNRSSDIHFFEGVPEMLAELRRRGYRTCLISNCNYLTPAVVEKMQIPAMLDEVILSCLVGLVKPELEIYQLGARRLGLTTSECLFVGDGGDSEMDGATAAGCQVALVAQERGHAFRFPAKTYPYNFRLETITELLDYLKQPGADSTAA